MLEGLKILIVEANFYQALDLCAAIEELGASVVGTAASLAEALQIVDRQAISAAVVDCDLPNGNAGGLIKALVKKGVPFVMQCTAGVPPELAMILPGAPILIKPIRPEDLASILASEIARSHNASES